MFSTLKSKVDAKIEATYRSYKKGRLKTLEKELASLVAKEKAILLRLRPIQERIRAKQSEIYTLKRSL